MSLVWKPGFTQWDPALITTALWLDAADASTITLNGSTVSQWNDKSGNNRNVSQATASRQPTYNATGLNSKPTLDFDGTDDFLQNASFEPAGAVTCFFVFNRDAIGGTFVTVDRSGGILEINGVSSAGYTNISFTATGAMNPALGFDIAGDGTNQNILFGLQYDGTGSTSSDFVARLNGTDQTVVNSGAFGFAGETGFAIGARPAQNINFYNGRISELIFVQSQTSLLVTQKIEGYLAHKWGLTANLPSNHPYKVNPPAP